MKKLLMILLCAVSAVCLAAMPFLLSHSSMLPEVATAYYEQKAQSEALTATGPEAELMRLLLGGAAAPAAEAEPTKPAFTWYGLWLMIGAALALVVLFALNRKDASLRSALMWTGALAVPMGLVGARLVYCLVSLPFYLKDIAAPEAMLRSWEGGLSLAGALVFIALAGLTGARLGKAPAAKVLDCLSVPMVWLAIASAGASKVIGMGFGAEIRGGFLSVTIGSTPRLDTAWLMSVVLSVMLIVIGLLLQKKTLPAGQQFALIAFLYGSVMILLESLRRDGHMVWGFVHAEMVLDLIFALPALLYLARTKKRILLCTAATAVLAGVVIALEFALDRSSIGDGWLYAAYIAVISAYIFLGCTCAKKRAAV